MKFVKITDETTALSLEERGFSFTKETINKGQTMYVFQDTPALNKTLNLFYSMGVAVKENVMRF